MLLPDVSLVWTSQTSFWLEINYIFCNNYRSKKLNAKSVDCQLAQEETTHTLTMIAPPISCVLQASGREVLEINKGEVLVKFFRGGEFDTTNRDHNDSTIFRGLSPFRNIIPKPYPENDIGQALENTQGIENKYRCAYNVLSICEHFKKCQGKFATTSAPVSILEQIPNIVCERDSCPMKNSPNNWTADEEELKKVLCIEAQAKNVSFSYIPAQSRGIKDGKLIFLTMGNSEIFESVNHMLLMVPGLSLLLDSETNYHMEFNLTFQLNQTANHYERIVSPSLLTPGFGHQFFMQLPTLLQYLEGAAPDNPEREVVIAKICMIGKFEKQVTNNDEEPQETSNAKMVQEFLSGHNRIDICLAKLQSIVGPEVTFSDNFEGQFLGKFKHLKLGNGFVAIKIVAKEISKGKFKPEVVTGAKEFWHQICIRISISNKLLTTYIPAQTRISIQDSSVKVTHFPLKFGKDQRWVLEEDGPYFPCFALVMEKNKSFRLVRDVRFRCDANGKIVISGRPLKSELAGSGTIRIDPLPSMFENLESSLYFQILTHLKILFPVSGILEEYQNAQSKEQIRRQTQKQQEYASIGNFLHDTKHLNIKGPFPLGQNTWGAVTIPHQIEQESDDFQEQSTFPVKTSGFSCGVHRNLSNQPFEQKVLPPSKSSLKGKQNLSLPSLGNSSMEEQMSSSQAQFSRVSHKTFSQQGNNYQSSSNLFPRPGRETEQSQTAAMMNINRNVCMCVERNFHRKNISM